MHTHGRTLSHSVFLHSADKEITLILDREIPGEKKAPEYQSATHTHFLNVSISSTNLASVVSNVHNNTGPAPLLFHTTYTRHLTSIHLPTPTHTHRMRLSYSKGTETENHCLLLCLYCSQAARLPWGCSNWLVQSLLSTRYSFSAPSVRCLPEGLSRHTKDIGRGVKTHKRTKLRRRNECRCAARRSSAFNIPDVHFLCSQLWIFNALVMVQNLLPPLVNIQSSSVIYYFYWASFSLLHYSETPWRFTSTLFALEVIVDVKAYGIIHFLYRQC